MAAQAAVISNGSFEDAGPANPFGAVLVGDTTTIENWEVTGTSGSLDYVGNLWVAADGVASVDLNGGGAQGLSQDITALIIGQAYRIAFALSGNPDGAPALKSLDVTVAGASTTGYTYDTGVEGTTRGDMKWKTTYYDFVASGMIQKLTFTSTTSDCCYGPVIDNVSISAVPLPAAGLLLLGGLGGLGFVSRKRKAA